ncbi:HlyD family type I secretion periplasmic adaptor subunit [Ruegeria halocynthiae]|uniref:HlyD family type I secretion periplasmic adaptor subunit n=1 Tax=Ruegeria halocynthiae TaxID=985054 RepID=UPI00055F92F0|nr:HlyD family type I secretion periplasmic adaptor subunit [Ruegeria halocynthiae]
MSEPRTHAQTLPVDRIGGWSFFGIIIGVGMLAAMAAWSMNTRIDGAVIAPAMVGLETDRQRVQHLEGGIVSTIHVREDQTVHQGQLLVELDTTRDQAELNAVASQIANLSVRRARLIAERTGTAFPPKDLGVPVTDTVQSIIAAEQQLFDSRSESQAAQAALLETRKQSLDAQIEGLRNQNHSLVADMALTEEELKTVVQLHEKGLLPVTRVLQVRRSKLNLEAGLSGNDAQVNSLLAQVAETESELRGTQATLAESIAMELTEADQQLRELTERGISLQDRVRRSRILAPRDGRVLNLAVHTQGGVIGAGEAVMEIVPNEEKTVLLANVPVTEIDRVSPGLEAKVRLTAFNLGQTPELTGSVRSVSADTLTDPVTNVPYYSAEISLSESELAKLNNQELVPGMPASVHIATGERLVASYLSRPLKDAFALTFRDE